MLADRVLAQQPVAEGERRSRAGILIPATAQVSRRLLWAEVVAVGPARPFDQGRRQGPVQPRGPVRGRGAGRRVRDPARARHPRRGVRAHRQRHRPLPVDRRHLAPRARRTVAAQSGLASPNCGNHSAAGTGAGGTWTPGATGCGSVRAAAGPELGGRPRRRTVGRRRCRCRRGGVPLVDRLVRAGRLLDRARARPSCAGRPTPGWAGAPPARSAGRR